MRGGAPRLKKNAVRLSRFQSRYISRARALGPSEEEKNGRLEGFHEQEGLHVLCAIVWARLDKPAYSELDGVLLIEVLGCIKCVCNHRVGLERLLGTDTEILRERPRKIQICRGNNPLPRVCVARVCRPRAALETGALNRPRAQRRVSLERAPNGTLNRRGRGGESARAVLGLGRAGRCAR